MERWGLLETWQVGFPTSQRELLAVELLTVYTWAQHRVDLDYVKPLLDQDQVRRRVLSLRGGRLDRHARVVGERPTPVGAINKRSDPVSLQVPRHRCCRSDNVV